MANLKYNIRKSQLLEIALKIAIKKGYGKISRAEIANKAGVSAPLINAYFKSLPNLKRKVMEVAISREILIVIAHGILLKDPIALKAPKLLQIKAIGNFVV